MKDEDETKVKDKDLKITSLKESVQRNKDQTLPLTNVLQYEAGTPRQTEK